MLTRNASQSPFLGTRGRWHSLIFQMVPNFPAIPRHRPRRAAPVKARSAPRVPGSRSALRREASAPLPAGAEEVRLPTPNRLRNRQGSPPLQEGARGSPPQRKATSSRQEEEHHLARETVQDRKLSFNGSVFAKIEPTNPIPPAPRPYPPHRHARLRRSPHLLGARLPVPQIIPLFLNLYRFSQKSTLPSSPSSFAARDAASAAANVPESRPSVRL